MKVLRINLTLFFLCISILVFCQPSALDKTFNEDGISLYIVNNSRCAIKSIGMQSNGKIVAVGTCENLTTGIIKILIVRYNIDGILDTSFNKTGSIIRGLSNLYDNPVSLVIQPDDKILIAGRYIDDFEDGIFLMRYNPNGTKDQTFGNNGLIYTLTNATHWYNAYCMTLLNDGKILIGGKQDENFLIIRYNSNGTIDSSFSLDGMETPMFPKTNGGIHSIAVQPDGKIISAGFLAPNTPLARFKKNGTLDSTFGVNGFVNKISGLSANSIVLQSDGKIVIGCNINNQFGLLRYNEDGTLDKNFSMDGVITSKIGNGSSCTLNSCLIQKDGKILAGGISQSPNNSYTVFTLVRYNIDGTDDKSLWTTNDITPQYNSEISSLLLQSDGKIIAAGKAGSNLAVVRYLGGNRSVNIESNPIENSVLIYPNPFKDKIVINYNLVDNDEISIKLYDLHGRLVKTFLTNGKQIIGKHEFTFSLPENLSQGMYYLNFSSLNEQFNIKVIK